MERAICPLVCRLGLTEAIHLKDRAGLPGVWLPDALDRKYANASRELAWFWVFPRHTLLTDPRSGIVATTSAAPWASNR